MSLAPGTRLGAYEISEQLGAGGMGEVYRARDTTLGRDVAIKILPASMAADPDRLARFEREAQTLAALNHPHIGHIYGVERTGSEGSGSSRAIVMELIEGEDLSQRIARGALPLDEALAIARQIADALESAHDSGIVHRDLKPANIKVRGDGTVKVLDFGLAKAVEQSQTPGSRPSLATLTSPAMMTGAGMILGTAAYMAPEQAKGRPVDRRADIWAFGVVLYEMLFGAPLFAREDVSETLAAVLTSAPDLQRLPPSTPDRVRRLLARCLAKDPRKRLDSCAVIRFELDEALSEPVTTPAGSRSRGWSIAAAALLGVLGLAGGWALGRRGAQPAIADEVIRFNIRLDGGATPGDGPGSPLAFSPDGRRIAFLAVDAKGERSIALRALDTPAVSFVPHTKDGSQPFFSPDGQSLAFTAGNRLNRVSFLGGTVTTILEGNVPQAGSVWGPDDWITYSNGSDLFRVAAAGGTPELVAKGENGARLRWPALASDGRTLALTIIDEAEVPALAFLALESRKLTRLAIEGMSPHFVGRDRLVWAELAANVVTARVDAEANEVLEAPQRIAAGVRTGPARVAKLAMARTGSFAYLSGGDVQREVVLYGTDGVARPIGLPQRPYSWARLSPDNRRIAIEIEQATSAMIGVNTLPRDIWTADLATGSLIRITSEGRNYRPVWTSDGRDVVYRTVTGEKSEWRRQRADGSGSVETLLDRGEELEIAADGRIAVYQIGDARAANGGDLWVGELANLKAARPLVATRFDETSAALAPRGNLLAYVSNEAGQPDVYVRGLDDNSPKWRVSRGGGAWPRWSADGQRLYFRSAEGIIVAEIHTGAAQVVGPLRQIAVIDPLGGAPQFDVLSDGRLLSIQYQVRVPEISVVLNWFDQPQAGGTSSGARRSR